MATNRPGRRSPFSEDQALHIRTYYEEWRVLILEHDPSFTDTNNKILTKWREKTADTIMRHELFSGKLSADNTLNSWEKKIRNCFITERARLKRSFKQKTDVEHKHDPRACEAGLRDLAKALVNLRTLELDARGLFRERNDEAIRQLATTIPASNVGASYQKALSELWKTADKLHWEGELQTATDIYFNQTEFCSSMYEALKALCQFGKLGDTEMILMYGVRGETHQLDVKVIHAHSLANDEDRSFDLGSVTKGFADWCEKMIPTPAVAEPQAGTESEPNLGTIPSAAVLDHSTTLADTSLPEDNKSGPKGTLTEIFPYIRRSKNTPNQLPEPSSNSVQASSPISQEPSPNIPPRHSPSVHPSTDILPSHGAVNTPSDKEIVPSRDGVPSGDVIAPSGDVKATPHAAVNPGSIELPSLHLPIDHIEPSNNDLSQPIHQASPPPSEDLPLTPAPLRTQLFEADWSPLSVEDSSSETEDKIDNDNPPEIALTKTRNTGDNLKHGLLTTAIKAKASKSKAVQRPQPVNAEFIRKSSRAKGEDLKKLNSRKEEDKNKSKGQALPGFKGYFVALSQPESDSIEADENDSRIAAEPGSTKRPRTNRTDDATKSTKKIRR